MKNYLIPILIIAAFLLTAFTPSVVTMVVFCAIIITLTVLIISSDLHDKIEEN